MATIKQAINEAVERGELNFIKLVQNVITIPHFSTYANTDAVKRFNSSNTCGKNCR